MLYVIAFENARIQGVTILFETRFHSIRQQGHPAKEMQRDHVIINCGVSAQINTSATFSLHEFRVSVCQKDAFICAGSIFVGCFQVSQFKTEGHRQIDEQAHTQTDRAGRRRGDEQIRISLVSCWPTCTHHAMKKISCLARKGMQATSK